jgi:hypothetical protein
MPFTGKATYDGGSSLPEQAEDIADLVAIAAGSETPLLDLLGDTAQPARGVLHEWLEDAPIPATAEVASWDGTWLTVTDAGRLRVHDQIRFPGIEEILLVAEMDGADARLVRGYGGTPADAVPTAGDIIEVIGNASLEGADAAAPRFTVRQRRSNVTQIFAATVEVSGSELAARQAGVADELEYQKAMRLRELVRELESSVINGVADAAPPGGNPAGDATTPRTMRGIIASLATHRFAPGVAGFPADTTLTETQLNLALRRVWESGGTSVDTIVVGGRQKRAINAFTAGSRRFAGSSETFRDTLAVYESDFGVCDIVMSRHVPHDTVLLLDRARIGVMPLAGRSFNYRSLARTGDREAGQIVGEYTTELRNEACHGLIRGLSV